MENIKICIIDSGIDLTHKLFSGVSLSFYEVLGMNICKIDKEFVSNDEIGHGTAIASILVSAFPECDYTIIKLFNSKEEPTVNQLILVFKFILEELNVDIVHISSGCSICEGREKKELEKYCNELVNKNKLIIAATDNEGCISYPASFHHVIGVDWNMEAVSTKEFVYYENACINIGGVCSVLKLPWKDSGFRNVSGASFAAPFITNKVIANKMEGWKSLQEHLNVLKMQSKKVVSINKKEENKRSISIKQAIIFPFNKEVHNIVRHSDLLDFKIVDVCDYKYSRVVGKSTNELLNCAADDFIIKNYTEIDWEGNFDTLILGHVRELSNILGIDLLKEFIDKCSLYKKQIYLFDSPDKYRDLLDVTAGYYSPQFTENQIPLKNLGKLFRFITPVIAIIGTSSKQGKFNLQLILKKKFTEIGYEIGHFATEPSGPLFNSDVVYHYGYGTGIRAEGGKEIIAANYLLNEVDSKNKDIILVGCQSHTVFNNTGHVNHYPLSTQNLLIGVEPDCCVLCFNIDDDLTYIRRTITYVESYLNSSVLGLCLFPFKRNEMFSLNNSFQKIEDIAYIKSERDKFSDFLDKPVFINGKDDDMDHLVELCIGFFGQE